MRSLTKVSFLHSINTYYLTSRQSADDLWTEELLPSNDAVQRFKARVHDGFGSSTDGVSAVRRRRGGAKRRRMRCGGDWAGGSLGDDEQARAQKPWCSLHDGNFFGTSAPWATWHPLLRLQLC